KIIPLVSGACLQPIAGDFNRDGLPDVVFRLERAPDFPITFVVLGNGDGTFTPATSVSNMDGFGMAVGDLNKDNIPERVLVGPGIVQALVGDGQGKLIAKGFFLSPLPTLFQFNLEPVIADLNGDGINDVGVANQFGNTLAVLLGNGDGTLGADKPFAGGG